MAKRPGGELATRPLHLIWICDCSGSMSVHGKIQALNSAIREALPHMQSVADDNPNAQVLVRAIRFATDARWHVSRPTPVSEFRWEDLTCKGETAMGAALELVARELRVPPMSDRALPPVLVLLSDGQPTDDFQAGLNTLLGEPWGKRSVRISIAIGQDADLSRLQEFIGHTERQPLQANRPEELVRCIKWVSTAVLKAVSNPATRSDDTPTLTPDNVPIPPPPSGDTGDDGLVW